MAVDNEYYQVGLQQFEWHRMKAKENVAKHNVSFREAATVFTGRLAVIEDDVEHSEGEPRETIIGYSNKNRLLLASFTTRGNSVRLISAREPDKWERRDYEERTLP